MQILKSLPLTDENYPQGVKANSSINGATRVVAPPEFHSKVKKPHHQTAKQMSACTALNLPQKNLATGESLPPHQHLPTPPYHW